MIGFWLCGELPASGGQAIASMAANGDADQIGFVCQELELFAPNWSLPTPRVTNLSVTPA